MCAYEYANVCVCVHLHASVVFTNTVIYTYLWGSVYFIAAYGRKFYYGPLLIGLLSMYFCPFICQVKIEQLMIWFLFYKIRVNRWINGVWNGLDEMHGLKIFGSYFEIHGEWIIYFNYFKYTEKYMYMSLNGLRSIWQSRSLDFTLCLFSFSSFFS